MVTVDDLVEQAADSFEVVRRHDQVRLFADGGRGNRIDRSTVVINPESVLTGIALQDEETLYMYGEGAVDTGSAYKSLRQYLFNAGFKQSTRYTGNGEHIEWFKGPYRLDRDDHTEEANPLQETLESIYQHTDENTLLVSPVTPYSITG
jgi:hypothetical protein